MSKDIYKFEPAKRHQAGHSLKQKVCAVYKLTGFIEKRYRNSEKDGAPEPYWSYVERGGKETGIESRRSPEAVQGLLGGKVVPIENREGSSRPLHRLFIGLNRQDGATNEVQSVLELIAQRLDTFTASEVYGYFKGKAEPTLIIEIAKSNPKDLVHLARDLADVFEQEAIGLEERGIYKRVYGSKRHSSRIRTNQDREQLNKFTSALSSGQTFAELDAETQAWWLNRY